MLGKLMKLWLQGMSYDSMLYNIAEPSLEGATPNLPMNLYNHIAYLQASDAAIHSASQNKFGYIFLLKTFPVDCFII